MHSRLQNIHELFNAIREEAHELVEADLQTDFLVELIDTIGWLEAALHCEQMTKQDRGYLRSMIAEASHRHAVKCADRGLPPLTVTYRMLDQLAFPNRTRLVYRHLTSNEIIARLKNHAVEKGSNATH